MGFLDRFRRPSMASRVAALEGSLAEATQERDLALSMLSRRQGTSAGTEMSWGRFQYDRATKLRKYDTRVVEFERMEQTDPHIKGALQDKVWSLMMGEWEIVPADDTERDNEIAEFVAANLLRKPSERFGREYWIQTSWKAQRLPEILRMLPDGFSAFCASWKPVGDKVVYNRLQWLEPATIDGYKPWELDDYDNLIALRRTYDTPQEKYTYSEKLPAEFVKLYVWDVRGARLIGQPFLRSLYGAFIRKEFALKMSSIAAQKFASPVPTVEYPASFDSNPEARERYIELAKALRGEAPAEAFYSGPYDVDGNGVKIGFAGAEVNGEGVDRMRGNINGENAEIAHGAAMKSQLGGETAQGSRAVSETQGKREIGALKAIATMVEEFENHGVGNLPGVIEELVERNYSGVQKMPELRCSSVDPFEHWQEISEAWKNGIIPKTADARRQIVEGRLGLNLKDDDYEVEPPVDPHKPGEPGSPTDPDPGPKEDEDEEAMSARLDAFRQRLAPMLEPVEDAPPGGRFRRGRNRLERDVCNLAGIVDAYRVGERDVMTVLRGIRDGMRDDLLRRLASGKITKDSVGSQRRSRFRGMKSSGASLRATLIETGERGMEHVVAEVERQA